MNILHWNMQRSFMGIAVPLRLGQLWLLPMIFLLICMLTPSAFSYEIDTTKVREKPEHHTSLGSKVLKVPQFVINLPVWTIEGIANIVVNDLVESESLSRLIAKFTAIDRVWGFYPVAGYGPNSGLKGGLTFTSKQVFTKGERVKIRGSYSTHDYQDYKFKYTVPSKFRPFRNAALTARYRQKPWESFYGIGNDSRKENEVALNLEESFVTVGWSHDLYRKLQLGLEGSYRAISVFDGEDPDLEGNISAIREKLSLSSHDFRSARIWSVGTSLVHDWRNSRVQTSGGGYESLSIMYNKGVSRSEDLKYIVARADLRHYVNVHMKRVLGLRILVEATNLSSKSTGLPYYLLRRLGGKDHLRSFSSSRYVGNHLALASLEYRYPIWVGVNGFVLFEEARVFETFKEDFTLKNWHYSISMGIRVWNQNGLVMNTHAAFGKEGSRFYLQLSEEI
jgi:outer membrane protein assembly factor BamA